MKKMMILLGCGALLCVAPAAFAANKKMVKKPSATASETAKPAKAQPSARKAVSDEDKASTSGYGTAGCGLGSIVFGEKKGPIQLVAGLLNAIGAQTFAISTGTSNCKPDLYNFHRNAQLFITVNKEILAKDISRGDGETIENLSQIMGCSDSKMLGGKLQQNYNSIFPSQSTSADDATHSIFELIRKDGELAQNCAKIG